MEYEEQREQEELVKAAKSLCDDRHRSGIILSGQIVNGKVELDQASLKEVAARFKGADRRFVAVNAPFDPNSI